MEGMLWKQSSVNILFSLQVLKLWKKGKEFLKFRATWVELVSGKRYKQLSFLIPKMKYTWKLNLCPAGSNHSKSTCHSWYLCVWGSKNLNRIAFIYMKWAWKTILHNLVLEYQEDNIYFSLLHLPFLFFFFFFPPAHVLAKGYRFILWIYLYHLACTCSKYLHNIYESVQKSRVELVFH